MVSEGIPAAVREFIARYFNSLEQVEILLLLYGSGRKEWAIEEVAAKLKSDPRLVARHLSYFWAYGLLSSRAGHFYRFNPRTAELEALVDGVAQAYNGRRVALVTTIYDKASSRLQAFSDAFKIRQDETDG